MPAGQGLSSVGFMIVAENLTKRFGPKVAVDDVSFELRAGTVTGFLGPNGAGKSTTMRMIVGLDRPDAGTVVVNGRPLSRHAAPLREVGALLDAQAVHPARSAYSHLRMLAASNGIGRNRVGEVMELTGIAAVARRKVGGFSLGMRQRLGIAAALLGDPHTVILDEPVNGLDPEGVQWMRDMVRDLAAEGRTILLSSHLMTEVAKTADHVIVLGRGRVLADAPLHELIRNATGGGVRVRVSDVRALVSRLAAAGLAATHTRDGALDVQGMSAADLTRLIADADIALHELTPIQGSLEDVYFALTNDEVEYRSASTTTQ